MREQLSVRMVTGIECTSSQSEHANEGLCIADDHVQCAERLLYHGASIAAVCEMGRTALHHAALARQPATVQLLLDAGAALEQPDNNGERPLDWACTGHRRFGAWTRITDADAPSMERMATFHWLLEQTRICPLNVETRLYTRLLSMMMTIFRCGHCSNLP